MSSTSIPTLYIWPAKWDLPSLEPASLAAVLYLQLSIPGHFAVVETANPDSSPSGQLPYLTHGHQCIAPLPAILKYVNGLTAESLAHENSNSEHMFSADLDLLLSTAERARRTAWCAHVESALGDLLAHTFYSLTENYVSVVHPALVSVLPVPQRYYVPRRVREAYQTRLEASGLWSLPGEEIEDEDANRPRRFGEPEKKPKQDTTKVFKTAFERERVLERARAAFDLYTRLLDDKNFFYYDRPTTLDVLLASHILLIINPPFPDTLLSSLISSSYPTLLAHAHRVYSAAFPTAFADHLHKLPEVGFTFTNLLPYPSLRLFGNKEKAESSEVEKRFKKMRWVWIGMAIASVAGYFMYLAPQLQIAVQTIRAEEERRAMEEGEVIDDDELEEELSEHDDE
ncbi:hypothetical protein DENSPDRAFT_864175 [Dentipellis sp. KUC8613]|nr:hypothetical protein DENSPDRAFT_864175 [Dentipellis sp. KUC8613]